MSELSGNSGELKPCPFCGKSPASQEHYDADGKLLACYVSCQNLHCSQFTFPKPLPWFKAGAWNTRPIEDELLKKIEQLQAEISRVAVFLAIHGVDGYTIVPNEPGRVPAKLSVSSNSRWAQV
jgi:hypothetical protein